MREVIIELSIPVRKALKKIPDHVVLKLQAWIESVITDGLGETRRIPGYHDEPLKDKWRGYRSIRLNKAYRAIYRISNVGDIVLIDIVEVNKHDYS